jgi:hypothetical protein
MNTLDAPVYTEASEQSSPRQVRLSHLSVEVGHFYMEDLMNGEDRIRRQFRRVAPFLEAMVKLQTAETVSGKPRVSTCFLIDDYFNDETDPGQIIEKLTRIAGEYGITIDYLAREAGCAEADGVPLAEITAAMLLPEPPIGTTGSRPPVLESGWLCNGEGSPKGGSDQAMRPDAWRPPVEFGKRNHSIFLDIELWKNSQVRFEGNLVTERQWSCPFLASVWQLVRLGALRDGNGEPVAQPQAWPEEADWPRRWKDLPAVIQLNPKATPFSAYRAFSILPRTYLHIEHAVSVILSHLDLDEDVIAQTVERARQEKVRVPEEIIKRLSHGFIDDSAEMGEAPRADSR